MNAVRLFGGLVLVLVGVVVCVVEMFLLRPSGVTFCIGAMLVATGGLAILEWWERDDVSDY